VRLPNRSTLVLALVVVAAVAVLALVVTGGGGSDTTLVSSSALAQAARETEKVPGATVSTDTKITVSGLAQPVEMHLEGVEDMRRKSARVVGTYANFPTQVPGTRPDGTIPVEIVSLPPDMYMKSPLLGSAVPHGKSWLHVNLERAGKQVGIATPGQFGQQDPTQTLRNLRATSDRVEKLGRERVRGVETTHYRATVQLQRLDALARPSQKAAVRAETERMARILGSDSYPIEVWIDSRHLVRRMRLLMKMHVNGQAMTMDMTADMYDFGPKPKAKRPPADDTYDASSYPGAGSP
jgi:hypothetical protein